MGKAYQTVYQVARSAARTASQRLSQSARCHPSQLRCLATNEPTTFVAANESALRALAAAFAKDRKPGDCYLFFGDVGVGKTTFSRAFIRAAAEDPFLQVPSPTYLLKNTYELSGSPTLSHFDLFRLGDSADWSRLQLEEAFQAGVSLVEWSERLRRPLPASFLSVEISIMKQVPDWIMQLNQQAKRQSSVQDPVDYHALMQREEELQEEEEEEEGGYMFVDRRWRLLRLAPNGKRWQHRLEEIRESVSFGAIPGLLVLDDAQVNDVALAAGLPERRAPQQ